MPTKSKQAGKHGAPRCVQGDGVTEAHRSISSPLHSSIARYAKHRATQIAKLMDTGSGARDLAGLR